MTKKARENVFRRKFKGELENLYPNAIISKMDPNDIQGIPDLLILQNDKWATFEMKRHNKATKRPNQEYYVNKMNHMSFSRFVSPENKDKVLDELQEYFNK